MRALALALIGLSLLACAELPAGHGDRAGASRRVEAPFTPGPIETRRPRLFIHPDSLSVIRDRIGAMGNTSLGSVSEYARLRRGVSRYSADFCKVADCGRETDLGMTDNHDRFFGPLFNAATLFRITQGASAPRYQRDHAAAWSKLHRWLERIEAEALSIQADFDLPLASLSTRGGSERLGAYHANLTQFGDAAAIWHAIDCAADTLETVDPDLRRHLFEIAIGAFQIIWQKYGAYVDGPDVGQRMFGYADRRRICQLYALLILLHGETAYDGTPMFAGETYSAEWLAARRDALFGVLDDGFRYIDTYGGGYPNGYNNANLQDFILAMPIHHAVPGISPFAPGNLGARNFRRAPRFPGAITNALYENPAKIGEYGGTPTSSMAQRFLQPFWFHVAGAYAFVVNDAWGIAEFDSVLAYRPSTDYGWMPVVYGDSLRARSTRRENAIHFGDVSTDPLGPDHAGMWSALRSDRDVARPNPWERVPEARPHRTGTIQTIVYGGPHNWTFDDNHGVSAGASLEIWYDAKLMTARGGTDQGHRRFAWIPKHKRRLLNTIQIDDLTSSDDNSGFPMSFNAGSGGLLASDPRARDTWVSRVKSFANGGHVRYELEAAYPNRLIREERHASWSQEDTFREITQWGPFVVVRDHVVVVGDDVRVSSVWRKSAFKRGLWTWDGSRTGGTRPNAHGGTPDAESSNSTYAEYTKPTRSRPQPKMRVSVPWASRPWRFVLTQGPAANGREVQGEYAKGVYDNGGDLSFELNLYDPHNPKQRRTSRRAGEPDYPRGADYALSIDDADDRGGKLGGGSLRVSMIEEAKTDGIVWEVLQVIELGPATAAFAACSLITVPGDTLLAAKVMHADTTLVLAYPGKDTRLSRGVRFDASALGPNGARVIVHGLAAPDTLTAYHAGRSLGKVAVDASGVVTFNVPNRLPNRIELVRE